MKAFEEELGTKLLIRGTKGSQRFSLTEEDYYSGNGRGKLFIWCGKQNGKFH